MMQIQVLKSKIHRATVTDADINYVGSITIDEALMNASNLIEFEKVQVLNINNGERIETYVIKGRGGSGTICLNGAAARKFLPKDLVIIVSYALMDFVEAKQFSPSIAFVDSNNKLVKGKNNTVMADFTIEETPQTNRVSPFIKFALFLGLGIFIIWLSLKGLTPDEQIQILHSFRIANYNWVILTIAMGITSHVLRALRWMLFFEPLGYHPSFKNTFFAVMVGYFANMAFPRLGEVTRCGILTRYEKIPFNKSFGTVITERAIDMIIFIFLFFLMIVTQAGTIGHYLNTNIYPKLVEKFNNPIFSRVFIFGSIAFVVIFIAVIYLMRKRIFASAMFHKIMNLIHGFWAGLKSLSQIKKPGFFIFYSIAIWALYFFMLYVCFFCFTDTSSLRPGAALSGLVLGSVGIMITPGGIGLYPAIIQETMLLYGIIRTTGLALGWISWTAQTSMILVLGGISLILLSFNKQTNGKA